MARLRSVAPRVSSLAPRVSVISRDERELRRHRLRDEVQPWRRWYKTARWQKLRLSVLIRDLYTCQDCGRVVSDTSQLVCDHIEPHRGDAERFWAGPFQTLCKGCHDSKKQRIDRAGKKASFHPDWLRPSAIPLTIVCGPPASGKSRYAHEQARPGDQIIDLDAIAAEMAGTSLHGWSRECWLHPALFKRNDLLGRLSGKPPYDAAWLIVSGARRHIRQWWADMLQPQRIVVLAVDADRCIANTRRDRDRDQIRTASLIRRWWSDYSPRSDDVVID